MDHLGVHQRAESFDPPNRTEDRALLRSSGGARSAVYPTQASGVITRPVKRQGSAQHARAVKQVLGPVHDILARLSEANRPAADPFEKWRRQAAWIWAARVCTACTCGETGAT